MEALATGYGLIEGPVWDDARGLLFADVLNGGVRALAPDATLSLLVPKRRGVGGMALHADGGLVMSGRDVIYQGFEANQPRGLLQADVTDVAVGFNDLTVDPAGRVWVGTLAFRPVLGDEMRPGHLHVIELDGSVRTVSDQITLSNGLGFSPDARRLYHSDSLAHLVRVYDLDEDGELVGWRPFAEVSGGIPDGLAVAEDGSVWVALAEGGRVLGFEPDGTLRQEISVPLPFVTSLCFGGEDLRDLFVVTGASGGPSDDCGTVYRLPAPVPGLPVPLARVAVA
jgi:gluconolactonase